MNFDDFLLWEQASRDTIDVKRCYIDVANDLAAGVLLSQFIFYHLPDDNGLPKSCIVEHEGGLWLAKKREAWWKECRLSVDQYDRACGKLQAQGVVKTKVFKLNRDPVKHVQILWARFFYLLDSVLRFPPNPGGSAKSNSRNRENGFADSREGTRESARTILITDRDINTADSIPDEETTTTTKSQAEGNAKTERSVPQTTQKLNALSGQPEDEQPVCGTDHLHSFTSSWLSLSDLPPGKPCLVPKPFPLTEEMREWAGINAPLVADLDKAMRRFINLNRSKQTMLAPEDWPDMWQQFMELEQTYAERDQRKAQQPDRGNGSAKSSARPASQKEKNRAVIESFEQKHSTKGN
jgi:hypothetical protein